MVHAKKSWRANRANGADVAVFLVLTVIMLAVFLPTTPNPTSGFLLFVPVADVNEYILVNQEGDEAVHSAAENAVVRGDGGFGSTDA